MSRNSVAVPGEIPPRLCAVVGLPIETAARRAVLEDQALSREQLANIPVDRGGTGNHVEKEVIVHRLQVDLGPEGGVRADASCACTECQTAVALAIAQPLDADAVKRQKGASLGRLDHGQREAPLDDRGQFGAQSLPPARDGRGGASFARDRGQFVIDKARAAVHDRDVAASHLQARLAETRCTRGADAWRGVAVERADGRWPCRPTHRIQEFLRGGVLTEPTEDSVHCKDVLRELEDVRIMRPIDAFRRAVAAAVVRCCVLNLNLSPRTPSLEQPRRQDREKRRLLQHRASTRGTLRAMDHLAAAGPSPDHRRRLLPCGDHCRVQDAVGIARNWQLAA